MASVKTKPLSDVAASHDLKAVYEAIMAFNSSNLAPINISKDFLDRQAEREATMDPLQGGDRGFTAGMKSILCHAAAEPLAKWLRLRSTFDAAIQAFKEKIEAVQNFEDNKRAIEKIARDKEEEVIRQAEASRGYLEKKRAKETADQHYDQLMQGQGGRPVNRLGVGLILRRQWTVRLGKSTTFSGISTVRM